MRSYKETRDLVSLAHARAIKNCEEIMAVKGGVVDTVLNGTSDEQIEAFTSLINSIQIAIEGIGSDLGFTFPKYIARRTAFYASDEDRVVRFEVNIKSKLKAEYKVRETIYVEVKDGFVSELVEEICQTVCHMAYVEEAGKNIDALNEVLEDIYNTEDVNYRVLFTYDDDKQAGSLEVKDNTVVYTADLEKALDIALLPLVQTDESQAICKEYARTALVEGLKACDNIPQTVKANLELVTFVTGTKSKKRADSMLRKTYQRRAEFLPKNGSGYIKKSIEINGEEVEVFAVVKKEEDGETLKVVVPAFNIKTNETVDIDTLSLVNAE